MFAEYLANILPSRADRIFKDSENGKCEIRIPAIAVAELVYVFEKTNAQSKIWDMFDRLEASPTIRIHPLDGEVLKVLADIMLKELHDRIIVATCKVINAKALITKDKEISKSKIIKTIY